MSRQLDAPVLDETHDMLYVHGVGSSLVPRPLHFFQRAGTDTCSCVCVEAAIIKTHYCVCIVPCCSPGRVRKQKRFKRQRRGVHSPSEMTTTPSVTPSTESISLDITRTDTPGRKKSTDTSHSKVIKQTLNVLVGYSDSDSDSEGGGLEYGGRGRKGGTQQLVGTEGVASDKPEKLPIPEVIQGKYGQIGLYILWDTWHCYISMWYNVMHVCSCTLHMMAKTAVVH